MSNDFRRVAEALAAGADPAILCATCPWDRHCVNPPDMTTDEIKAQEEKAKRQDEETAAKARAEGKEAGAMPIGSLMTMVMLSGRDTSASVCPVFAARLQSSDGRRIADLVRTTMQAWDDGSVSA